MKSTLIRVVVPPGAPVANVAAKEKLLATFREIYGSGANLELIHERHESDEHPYEQDPSGFSASHR